MNAPVKLTSGKQSFEAKCKSAHWRLLQSFAKAERTIEQALGPSDAVGFGGRLKLLPDIDQLKRTKARLIEARNLLAHGHLEVVETSVGLVALWSVADRRAGLDSRSFSLEAFSAWVSSIENDLEEILRALADPPKSK